MVFIRSKIFEYWNPGDKFVISWQHHNKMEFGMWRSPVAHYVRDVGVAGSNPVIPTKDR